MTERLEDRSIGRLYIFAMFLTVAGVFLRLYAIDAKSFWIDEGLEAAIATGLCWADRAVYYTHTFFFNAAVHGLLSMGADDAWLRFVLAALPSALCVPLAMWLTYLLSSRPWIAVATGFFMTVSPLQIAYAQEIRPYAFMAFSALGSTILFVHFLRNFELRWGWPWSLLSTVALLCMPWYVLVFASQYVFFLVRVMVSSKRSLRSVASVSILPLLAMVVAVCGTIVYLVVFRYHLQNIPAYVNFSFVDLVSRTFGFLFAYPLLGLVFTALALLGVVRAKGSREGRLVVGIVATCLIATLVYRAIGSSKFSVRFLVPLQPFFFVLVALGLWRLGESLRRRRAAAIGASALLVVYGFGSAVGLMHYYQRPAKSVQGYDFRAQMQYLTEHQSKYVGIVTDIFYFYLLQHYYAELLGDRPVIVLSPFPDMIEISVPSSRRITTNEANSLVSATGEPRERMWVSTLGLMPYWLEGAGDEQFTNDLVPWWAIKAEQWNPQDLPRMLTDDELKSILASYKWGGTAEKAYLYQWKSSDKTCLVRRAFGEDGWDWWRHAPGLGASYQKGWTGN